MSKRVAIYTIIAIASVIAILGIGIPVSSMAFANREGVARDNITQIQTPPQSQPNHETPQINDDATKVTTIYNELEDAYFIDFEICLTSDNIIFDKNVFVFKHRLGNNFYNIMLADNSIREISFVYNGKQYILIT